MSRVGVMEVSLLVEFSYGHHDLVTPQKAEDSLIETQQLAATVEGRCRLLKVVYLMWRHWHSICAVSLPSHYLWYAHVLLSTSIMHRA